MNTTILKVIVIDSDPKFHESYNYFFSTYRDYRLVGIYRTVEDALANYEMVNPDIILSEVNFLGLSGIEGLVEFQKAKDPAVVIMVSHEDDYERIMDAFRYGAEGYLTKPIGKKRLRYALKAVKDEGAALSSDVAKKLISMYRKKTYQFFSERENQIIEYLGKGATYKVIADKLYITPSTVNFHIQNIYLKLDVNSKSKALKKIREMNAA
ncbi:response regulator [Muriicola soli]|uniref:Response regulator transcription factor n=1 Tax=Muriicola soli TaxID=2507538 RepID=A0A411E8U5_9FLAO|nr:response regulator transcription factor [Muriicola soli]QBA63954.1 response regulator transcription factor [Muriicola soli]